MAYVTLRRVPVANVSPATGYTVHVEQWDTDNRRRYQDSYQAATNTGANAPFELTVGQLVPGASFCIAGTQRQVKYAGNGTVSTHDVPNAPACASSLTGLTLTSSGLKNAYTPDAQITATWSGASGPVTVRCGLLAPGTEKVAAYYNEQSIVSGNTSRFPAVIGTATLASFDTRSPTARRLEAYNANTGLGPGRYRVEVTEDATGYTLTADLTVTLAIASDPDTVVLYGGQAAVGGAQFIVVNGPLTVITQRNSAPAITRLRFHSTSFSGILLYLHVFSRGGNIAVYASFYEPSTGQIDTTGISSIYDIIGGLAADDGRPISDSLTEYTYYLPAGHPIVTLSGGITVFSNGQGGVMRTPRLIDGAPLLHLDNLILFQPDRPDGTGGVILEVHTDQDYETAPVVAYQLYDDANGLLDTNLTGRFAGLAPGPYRVVALTGGVPLEVPFTMACAYGLKYQLAFSDLHNHKPCRLELWVRDYTGSPVPLEEDAICGQGDGPGPVRISSEGLSGGENQNDLPDSIGTALTMRLRTAPGLLQDILLDDRACRADFYYDDERRFAGFVQPEIYDEALLAGPVEVELTAACGLAGLKDVDFAGQVGQELRGRRALLPTLLHCLSRTGVACGLSIYTNRVAAEMTTDDVPELAAFSDRLGYTDNDRPKDLRTVVNAICQALGGTLVQRYGRWELISPLEAAKEAVGRVYDPAGAASTTDTLPSPAGRIVPGRMAKALFTATPAPRAVWYWLGAEQHRQRRAGWKFFTGTADATYAANAFRQGEYFGNADFWDESATALRPEAGWQAGPGGFPLSLVEAGGDSDEVAARWPIGNGQALSTSDPRYLESELAPVEAAREGLPMQLSIEAKYVSSPLYVASLWVELIAERPGSGPVSLGAVLTIPSVQTLSDGFKTLTASIPFGLLTEGMAARVRLHPAVVRVSVVGNSRPRVDDPVGDLLLKSVKIQLLPQGAKWDGSTSFVASGPGGSVRPGSPLEVFHVDAPDKAGLFRGVAYAFRNTLTRGPADPITQWARADDLQLSPLLAANVLDVLALRANPSQLLAGTVRYLGQPPEVLDAIDAPYDVNGRRFCVGSRTWNVRPATADVTLIEIGEGEYLTPEPALPDGLRIIDGLAQGQLRYRATERGLRIAITA